MLRSQTQLPSGRPFDVRYEPRPKAYIDSIRGFHLRPQPGESTRLIVRARARSRRGPSLGPWTCCSGSQPHLIMQTSQLHNLRRRVSAMA